MNKKQAAQQAYDLMREIPRDESGNPLTLEGAIRAVILKGPDCFQYRDDALGLIYCVLGSGVGWIEGRIGDTSPNNYMNMPPQVGGQGIWSHEFGLAETFRAMKLSSQVARDIRQEQESRLAKAICTITEIDSRCQMYAPVPPSWYPISWYACNLCAPANAQEDFFLGAIETATLICQMTPTPGTQRWIVHQRTRGYAEEILYALHSRAKQ